MLKTFLLAVSIVVFLVISIPSHCMYRRVLPTCSLVHRLGLRMSSCLPALPTKSLTNLGESLQQKMLVDLQIFESEIQAEEGQKDGFFKLSRSITVAAHEMLQLVRNGEVDRMQFMMEENKKNIYQVSLLYLSQLLGFVALSLVNDAAVGVGDD